MLSPRAEIILRSIIERYIERGVPVSSHSLVQAGALRVCSATVRNDIAALEREGFIIHPHTSAGSMPTDKGYRYYVTSLRELTLPVSEQRLISHLFHQVEGKLEEWLSLAAAVTSQLSRNVALVSIPKPADCQFRHLELLILQDRLVLLVLVLRGARVKQQLITLSAPAPQDELTTIADRLNAQYHGLTSRQIQKEENELSPAERQLTDCVAEMMQAEDVQEHSQCYLEGLHFMVSQPEFSRSGRQTHLLELLRNKSMLLTVLPHGVNVREVQVAIGNENEAEAIRDCGVVVSRYGLPNEAVGVIGVIGPTRMPYAHIMSAVSYLSSVLTVLVGELYGVRTQDTFKHSNSN
ncbi:MAG: heat-inducible transcriptional repressor HrcA [Dehalococcoidia bacterium]|nr:heat-inducible transcriptional repressor HrcA [Dehalococcoidia bacterium]